MAGGTWAHPNHAVHRRNAGGGGGVGAEQPCVAGKEGTQRKPRSILHIGDIGGGRELDVPVGV